MMLKTSTKWTAVLPALVAVAVMAATVALTPESVTVKRLPLPPTAPSSAAGSCTTQINPNGTGCIDGGRSIDGARSFSPDGNHVYVSMKFAGAPATGPASVYSGPQLIMVKTDGTTFANGDAWKCVTCGVPAANKVGASLSEFTYPEAFYDGKRVKAGLTITDCSPYDLTAPECTPAATHIYPIVSPFPANAIMREIRLHPDNVHLGWNALFLSSDYTAATEYGAFGRLEFDPGVPAYNLTNVSWLLSPILGKSGRFFSVGAPGELILEPPTGVIGEFRGFTPDGQYTLGHGSQDSFNYDIFATSLATGASIRLTHDPAYTDPSNISPDGNSLVILDGRITDETGYPGAKPAGSDGRLYFASAGIGVPPLIDLAIAEAVGNLYTGARGSYLQPYLINLQTPIDVNDPDIHDGQVLNENYPAGCGNVNNSTAGNGGISDPLWLAGADPAWSPDSTKVVYYQRRFDCDPSRTTCLNKEPGGRQARLMIATLNDRQPSAPLPPPGPVNDVIPWGISYTPGDSLPPSRPVVPAGTYTLNGMSGSAQVVIGTGPSRFKAGDLEVVSVEVTYYGYSADGVNFIDGTESGVRGVNGSGQRTLTWHADLEFSGLHTGGRITSEPGGFVVTATSLAGGANISGTLITTLDGEVYSSETIQ